MEDAAKDAWARAFKSIVLVGVSPAFPGGWRKTETGQACLEIINRAGYPAFGKLQINDANRVRIMYARIAAGEQIPKGTSGSQGSEGDVQRTGATTVPSVSLVDKGGGEAGPSKNVSPTSGVRIVDRINVQVDSWIGDALLRLDVRMAALAHGIQQNQLSRYGDTYLSGSKLELYFDKLPDRADWVSRCRESGLLTPLYFKASYRNAAFRRRYLKDELKVAILNDNTYIAI